MCSQAGLCIAFEVGGDFQSAADRSEAADLAEHPQNAQDFSDPQLLYADR